VSEAALTAVKAEQRSRVAIHADDPELAGELRRILVEAGYEVIEEAEAPGFSPVPPEPQTLLTPRELEVLGAIGEGLTNKAIARRLDISLHTVKFHIEAIFRKLGARTRTEALARAAERRVEL
jgi:DNA-binding CsgD family transcriptional regulator